MRLLRVELRRFRSRALVRWGAVGAVVIALFLVLGSYQTSAPVPQAQVDQMRADYDSAAADWAENKDEYIAQCEDDEAAQQATEPTADYDCENGGPGAWADWIGGTSSFSDAGVDGIASFAGAFLMVALVLGITSTAAEMSTGAIGNWLTFEPRRRRVYWSKLAAAGVGVLPIVAVALAVATAGSWLAFRFHDALGTMTGEVWADLAWSLGRTLVAASACAVMGAALGMLTRHTAAALGVVAGWFVVVELMTAHYLGGLQRWLPLVNFSAWVSGSSSYFTESCAAIDGGGGLSCTSVDHTVSLAQGGVVLAGMTVVIAVVGALVFRRRDIA